MPSLSFTLADAGLVHLGARHPRLFFIPEAPSTTDTHLLVTAPVEVTITGAGACTVTVVASDETIPQTRYTLRATWDTGRELDVLTGLIVPADAATLRDVMIATDIGPLPPVFYGFGDPTPVYSVYYDIAGMKPVLWLRGASV